SARHQEGYDGLAGHRRAFRRLISAWLVFRFLLPEAVLAQAGIATYICTAIHMNMVHDRGDEEWCMITPAMIIPTAMERGTITRRRAPTARSPSAWSSMRASSPSRPPPACSPIRWR